MVGSDSVSHAFVCCQPTRGIALSEAEERLLRQLKKTQTPLVDLVAGGCVGC